MFSHNGGNGPESETTRMFHPVCRVAAPGRRLPSVKFKAAGTILSDGYLINAKCGSSDRPV